jgi:hypothetical protein
LLFKINSFLSFINYLFGKINTIRIIIIFGNIFNNKVQKSLRKAEKSEESLAKNNSKINQ